MGCLFLLSGCWSRQPCSRGIEVRCSLTSVVAHQRTTGDNQQPGATPHTTAGRLSAWQQYDDASSSTSSRPGPKLGQPAVVFAAASTRLDIGCWPHLGQQCRPCPWCHDSSHHQLEPSREGRGWQDAEGTVKAVRPMTSTDLNCRSACWNPHSTVG